MKIRRINNPLLRKVASEITMKGEFGRAIPGQVQAQVQAQQKAPAAVVSETPAIPSITSHTEMSTYFTKIGGSQLLYSAENWTRIFLMLETAGPVSASTRQDIVPVLSGKAPLLPTNVEVSFDLPKGDRLYVTATAVNRLRVIIQPIPWQEQIAMMTGTILNLLKKR